MGTNEDIECRINGIYIPSVYSMIDTIIHYRGLFVGRKSEFHGDLVLDNIIDTGTDFILIDWRENFVDDKQYGDIYYDFAKFEHSLFISHKMLNDNNFLVDDITTNESKYKEYRVDIYRSQIHLE